MRIRDCNILSFWNSKPKTSISVHCKGTVHVRVGLLEKNWWFLQVHVQCKHSCFRLHVMTRLHNINVFSLLFGPSGQWECKEGETEVTLTEMPWYPGEPTVDAEECAILSIWRDSSGKWNDLSCISTCYTVCKQPLPVFN